MLRVVLTFLLVIIFFNVSSQVNLQNGLIGCYPFSGNATDQSGNNNNGTVDGATLTMNRFGNANSACLFNGTTSISVAPAPITKLHWVERNLKAV
jgi:hypothetical protein